jgi:hypothetical protein
MRPARRLCYLAWRRGVAPVCVTRGASGLPGSAPQRGPGWGRECLSCDPVPARVSIDRSEARQVASGLRVKVHPAVERLDHPDLTQELPRKLLPTRAKEAQRRRRQKRSFTRRCLWRVGCTLDLKRAHNPKVAGSNPAPATMNDEGLADASAANPFRLPRLHPGIGLSAWLHPQRGGSPTYGCEVLQRYSVELFFRQAPDGLRSRIGHSSAPPQLDRSAVWR